MGPDLTPAGQPGTTCPSCRASVRPDADWCSLCYAVLRAPTPAPEPVHAPAPEPAYAPAYAPPSEAQPRHAAPDPLTAPLLEVVLPLLPPEPMSPLPTATAQVAQPVAPVVPAGAAPAPEREPTWPCTSCGTTNPLAAPVCSVCGSGFLAAASSTPKLVLPVVGDLGAMSRGQRIAAALAVVMVLLMPVALVTLLMTDGGGTGTKGQPQVVETTTP